jgi:hypothetical protein
LGVVTKEDALALVAKLAVHDIYFTTPTPETCKLSNIIRQYDYKLAAKDIEIGIAKSFAREYRDDAKYVRLKTGFKVAGITIIIAVPLTILATGIAIEKLREATQ